MKKSRLQLVFNCYLVFTLILMITGCQKSSPSTPTCTTTGTAVNIGGTSGGTYYGQLVTGYAVMFSNTNLNFSLWYSYGGGEILDLGAQSCLDFSYSGTPTALNVAYVNGHGYIGKFGDGRIVKFIAGDYSSGSVLVHYVFQ